MSNQARSLKQAFEILKPIDDIYITFSKDKIHPSLRSYMLKRNYIEWIPKNHKTNIKLTIKGNKHRILSQNTFSNKSVKLWAVLQLLSNKNNITSREISSILDFPILEIQQIMAINSTYFIKIKKGNKNLWSLSAKTKKEWIEYQKEIAKI